ncbi:hypothetical protein ACWCQQ_47255 [Streptomyces sp. NPDC002143]
MPRRFDLVGGADGLHSNVRRLVFDEESRFNAFIGAYLGVLTLPNVSDLDGELLIHVGVGRTVGMSGARHLGDARALLLFRSELDYHHHGVPWQRELRMSWPESWRGRAATMSEPSPPTSARWRSTYAAAARSR